MMCISTEELLCCGTCKNSKVSDATDGIFLGIDAVRRAPIFMDLFRQNQAAHTVILGKTGYGKVRHTTA